MFTLQSRSMPHVMSQQHDAMDDWPAPGRYCSSCDEDMESCSDDGPLLAYKYAKPHSYDERSKAGRRRRCPCSLIRRIFIICASLCLLCIILYIPLYIRAIGQVPVPENDVDGWSLNTNRDTKLYIQPGYNTTLLNTKIVCQKYLENKLFLLIIVTSAPKHFENRQNIRKTWGNNDFYQKYSKLSSEIKQKYKNYNYTYDLYVEHRQNISKRDISIKDLLPKLAAVLSDNNSTDDSNINNKNEHNDQNRDDIINEFDMNQQFGDKESNNEFGDKENNNNNEFGAYDYDYESNVMKIPPRGYEENVESSNIIDKLKKSYATLVKNSEPKVTIVDTAKPKDNMPSNVEFKVVFILGLPNANDTDVDVKIKEEATLNGDIIQENFTDTYNNLTLKSIMMLKWVTTNCYENVNYVMKTDDDMFINVVNLIELLRKESGDHERRLMSSSNAKQYLLIGDSIKKAKPNLNTSNKWYSPRYMYNSAVYPDYLSGTGYVMSMPTVHSLYAAALFAPYFHLEDIYITGICANAARPKLVPRDVPGFLLSQRHPTVACHGKGYECTAHADITLHALPAEAHARIVDRLLNPKCLDLCERVRLTEVRRQRIKPKKRTKH